MSTMGDRLKVKLHIKQSIEHHLYGQFDDRMKSRLEALIDRNNILTQFASESFQFRGVRYIKQGWRVHPRHIKRIHPELDADISDYVEDLQAINDYERPIVMGYVQTVLNTSAKPEDFLVLFPSSLVTKFQEALESVTGDSTHISIDDAESLVKAHSGAYELLKVRLMANLLGVD